MSPRRSARALAALALALAFLGCTSAAPVAPVAPPSPAPPPLYGAAVAERLSPQIVYASRVGVATDGTDQTSKVQAALDATGSAGMPLDFVFDVGTPTAPVMLNGLRLWSNQTVRGLGGAALKKVGGGSSAGVDFFSNRHPIAYPAAQTDHDITIRDLFIDHNKRGGGAGAGGSAIANATGQPMSTIGLYGVNRFNVQNVIIYDTPSYGVHPSNACFGLVSGVTMFVAPGDNGLGNNVIQFQGGSHDIACSALAGNPNDDPWAINPNDGNDTPGSTVPFFGAVHQGPITDIVIRDSIFTPGNSGSHGGRILTSNPASYAANITISNVTCTIMTNPLDISTGGLGLGAGWVDNLTIDGCTFYLAGGGSGQPAIRNYDVNAGIIKVRDCTFQPIAATSAAAAIHVGPAATTYLLDVAAPVLNDSSGWVSAPLVRVDGSVNALEIRGGATNRGASATAAGPAFQLAGTIGRAQVVGGCWDRYRNVVAVTGGTTGGLVLSSFSHTNAGGGASVAVAGGTLSRLRSSGADTSLLSSGTIGSTKTDSTQDN